MELDKQYYTLVQQRVQIDLRKAKRDLDTLSEEQKLLNIAYEQSPTDDLHSQICSLERKILHEVSIVTPLITINGKINDLL